MSLQGPDASICDNSSLQAWGLTGVDLSQRVALPIARTSMTPSPATMKATSKVPDSPQHP